MLIPMARLPLTPADPDDPTLAALFAELRGRGVEPPHLYRTLGHAPKMLRAWVDLAWPLRLDAATPRRTRELVILRVAYLTQAPYEWAHHEPMALDAGVRPDQLEALPGWEGSDAFDDEERVVLAYADAVVAGDGVDDATFAALTRRFDAAAVVELTLTASFYVCVARLLRALDVEVEPDLADRAATLASRSAPR